ncbi:hypothetical protein CVT24_002867 [Panaeolus cyanescens]|uniref:TLC domain-containing protein n=1 Tax=Panaeolus cyanescens TaxID=181874 RepID=A0A409YRK3_9AGAR|nr:hypothetical protein CVT24_002867 [Panaeolus cyanescens]
MAFLDALGPLKPYITPFFTLQYPVEAPLHPDSFTDSSYYNAGKLDFCLVITMIAVMAVLRDGFRLMVFEPFARWKLLRDLDKKRRRAVQEKEKKKSANGHANGSALGNGKANGNGVANGNGNGHAYSNGHANGSSSSSPLPPPSKKELRQIHRSVLRFAEQGWSVVYYPLQWAFGLYVHMNLPTQLLNPKHLWIGYPHIPLAGPLKLYYLSQTAFYMHQVLVINAEARRKDHLQMMTHHVITIVLMVGSYFTHFTRVGCVIMFLMDWCDIFLPLAKMIRYANISQTLCDATFVVFMVSWLATRHFLFLHVIHSTVFVSPTIISFQWNPSQNLFLTKSIHHGFSALLIALQFLQMMWFAMIVRTAWRVVRGSGASDDRSDEEDVDEKDE